MKVRFFRRRFQGTWRLLSRIAVILVCLEVVGVIAFGMTGRAAATDAVGLPAPGAATQASDAQGEKLAS